jgi:DNA invertase Pin-like site-specific DNA recombinase
VAVGFCDYTVFRQLSLGILPHPTDCFDSMPQIQLPFFPEGVTQISDLLAFRVEDGIVTYFNGNMPVFIHDKDDIATFRMITAQFCVNGNARQAEVARVFGIPNVTVKRAVKRYREEGPKGFYTPRKPRGAAVLTAEVMAGAQRLLDDGLEPAEAARRLELKPDTLSKAVRAGRLHKRSKKKTLPPN